MNKIICDVCGTSYLESAECCPICGCTRDEAILLGEEFSMDDRPERGSSKGGAFATKKKAIFDFDEVNSVRHDESIQEVRLDEEEPLMEPPKHNTFAVIVLTVLIAVLLLLAGFLFLRYFLPNKTVKETVATTSAQIQEATEASQTIAIPCESLALTSGTATLNTEGAFFLINVSVYPENTTDKLIFHSADSSVATVDESGRITAVSDGSTVVYITCGTQQIPCEVICDFAPATVETTVATEASETYATEPIVTDPVETVAPTVAETVPETEAVEIPAVELKLMQSDIILEKAGTWTTLRLDCDLNPEDVQWTSEHEYIATVDETGVVKAVGKGITEITASYGDQTVKCIVRCKW